MIPAHPLTVIVRLHITCFMSCKYVHQDIKDFTKIYYHLTPRYLWLDTETMYGINLQTVLHQTLCTKPGVELCETVHLWSGILVKNMVDHTSYYRAIQFPSGFWAGTAATSCESAFEWREFFRRGANVMINSVVTVESSFSWSLNLWQGWPSRQMRFYASPIA